MTDVPWDVYFEAGSTLHTELGTTPWTITAHWQDTNNKLQGELSLHHFVGLAVSSAAHVGPPIVGGQKLRASMMKAAVPTIASAATLTVPTWSDVVKVSGSTSITSITASYASRRLTIIWASGATFDIIDGGNLRVVGDVTGFTEDDSVTLSCDGTNLFVTGGKSEGTTAPRVVESAVSMATATTINTAFTATPAEAAGAGRAANELYLWGGGGSAPTGVALNNTEMDWLDARGFKHIHMGIGRLRGFGGSPAQDFRADGGPVTASNYDYQEQIQNSQFVTRWHAYGADHKAYLQWDTPKAGDPSGAAIADWYTDGTSTTGWTEYCNRLQELAAYANWQGFDGISSDWEVFNNNDDAWHWDRWLTTDTHTQAQVRQKAFDRGVQMMTAILAGMPNADVYVYNMFEPGGWHESRSYWNRTHGSPAPTSRPTVGFNGICFSAWRASAAIRRFATTPPSSKRA